MACWMHSDTCMCDHRSSMACMTWMCMIKLELCVCISVKLWMCGMRLLYVHIFVVCRVSMKSFIGHNVACGMCLTICGCIVISCCWGSIWLYVYVHILVCLRWYDIMSKLHVLYTYAHVYMCGVCMYRFWYFEIHMPLHFEFDDVCKYIIYVSLYIRRSEQRSAENKLLFNGL